MLLYGSTVFPQELLHITDTSDITQIKRDNKDKVLLINFWATWCEPCIEEFPDLLKLYKEYASKDFKLILISLDFKEEIETKLIKFLSNSKVDFDTYYLNTANPDVIMNYLDKKWDGGIPASFIFDKKGNLQKFILGKNKYEYFESEIKEHL